MKKLSIIALLMVVTAALAAGPSASQTPPPAKTWICHKADANKYVAIRVAKSQVRGHMRHGDVPVPVASQNRTAARAYCALLPPITPARGGQVLDGTLAPTGGNTVGSGTFTIRASVGQQRVCWTLTVNLTAAELATTGSVILAHIHGPLPATGIFQGFTLTAAQLASLNASLQATGTGTVSGCETNVSKAKIRQILQNPSDFFVNVHTTTFGGGALQGTLSR
jgi:CHRD domain